MKSSILVTGASGFLGGRLAKFLPEAFPDHAIVGVSRSSAKAAELEAAGGTFIRGDVTDPYFCLDIMRNVSAIVHCAALSAPWGSYEAFEQANIITTQNLLNAALHHQVQRFVLIATPSVYFNFKNRRNVTEAEPLPSKMVNTYAATKLIAEQQTLALNGQGIQTVALRPRAIIGGEDTVIFPRLLKAYADNKLRIIGSGKNTVDLTCVRNVLEAVVCTLRAPEAAMGRSYNISNGEPVNLWEEINYVLSQLGYAPLRAKAPYGVMMALAWMLEQIQYLTNPAREPVLTRYSVAALSLSFSIDISLAQTHLGYRPVQSTREGINEFIAWYKTHQSKLA